MLNWMFLLIRLNHTCIATMILIKVGLCSTKRWSLEVSSLEALPFLITHLSFAASWHTTLDLLGSWLYLNRNLINISRILSGVINGLKLRSGLDGTHFDWRSDSWIRLILSISGASRANSFLFLTNLWNLRLIHVRISRSFFFLLGILPRWIPGCSLGGDRLISRRDCIWNHFVVLRVFRSQFINFSLQLKFVLFLGWNFWICLIDILNLNIG
jgi:hypothetical protein